MWMASRGKLLVGLCRETRMPLLKTNVEAADADVDWSSPDIFDDSDADPNWLPCDSPNDSLSNELPSSPLTSEQIEVSAQAEQILLSSEYDKHSLLGSIDQNQNKRKAYLNVQKQIADWKEKRKEAERSGRRAQVRRLSRKIRCVTSTQVSDIIHPDDGLNEGVGYPQQEPESSSHNKFQHLCDGNTDTRQTKHPNRKRNYCLFCDKLVAKFGEHLERCHSDKPEVIPLLYVNTLNYDAQKKRVEKMKITYDIKKKWNSTYNLNIVTDNNSKPEALKSLIPVKRSKEGKTIAYVLCNYCDGLYSRRKLSVHLKTCSMYLSRATSSSSGGKTSAIKQHSAPVVLNQNHVTSQFKKEILQGINVDNIMETALNDPLIMKFGSEFHESRREPASKNYVIREIRDLGRLFLEIKNLKPNITSFKECLNPSLFDYLIAAARKLSDYQEESGVANVPSIAYRLTQPLKDIAKLVKTEELSKIYRTGDSDQTNIKAIDDFLQMLQDNWGKRIGRICTKSQKFLKANRTDKMALEGDIIKLAAYIESEYRKLLKKLSLEKEKSATYDLIMHMLVTHIMLLIRRRPVDFKHANLEHYSNLDKHDELLEMVKDTPNSGDLSSEDFDICKRFHIFFVPGKNLEVVPMVLTPIMKSVLDDLLTYRKNVGVSGKTLFALSKNRLIKPNESIKMMTRKVTLKRPRDLTGNGLRHQAATFSKLHATHPQYQDFLASALGHTLSVHKKHYDLPLGVLQKIMVCPILHDIMTGKNKQEEKVSQQLCHLEEPVSQQLCHLEEPAKENQSLLKTRVECPDSKNQSYLEEPTEEYQNLMITPDKYPKPKKRWTEQEEHTVLTYFGKDIIDKVAPKRGDVVDFLAKHNEIFKNRTIAQVYMYVRNHCNRTQKNVTPKVKRFLKLDHH